MRLFVFTYKLFSITLLYFISVSAVQAQDSIFQFDDSNIENISSESINNDDDVIYISDRWKFQPGDNIEWALTDIDDTEWETISTNLSSADLSFIDWGGIGWFRKKIDVAENLTGKPLALIVDRHLGASEIYINGQKVHELGRFSTNPDLVETYEGNELPVVVFKQGINTIAVRFVNPMNVETEEFFGYIGFRFLLGDWQSHQNRLLTFIQNWTGISMFYTGILLTFWLIHFLLFLFYPKEKRNLYFALFTGGLVVITYILYRMEMARFTVDTIMFLRFALFFEIMVLTFAVRFMHTIDENQKKLYSNIVIIFGFTIGILVWFYPAQMIWIREIVILAFIIELIRLLVIMFQKRRKGVWVIGAGMLVFVFGLITTVLINFNILEGNVLMINIAGSGLLILSMSLFLSREFAATKYNLEDKLREVKSLSEKTLEQERINKEKEIETRLLEAENNRKSKELEEARALQLSMLPKKLPTLTEYDMAVYMDTATEVGGDYYDYSLPGDGTLVLALGDATGHGMKAGIMVAAAKSYFHSLVHEESSLAMLKRMSSGLHTMNMKMMYMGLTLVRCSGNRVGIATAGMPPAIHFKNSESDISRITLKGLPLGSSINYPYKGESIELQKGDVLLLMSDGLIELFNSDREMLGIEKVENLMKNSSGLSAGDIVNQLRQLVETWSGGKEPEDDITFLVVRYTG